MHAAGPGHVETTEERGVRDRLQPAAPLPRAPLLRLPRGKTRRSIGSATRLRCCRLRLNLCKEARVLGMRFLPGTPSGDEFFARLPRARFLLAI